MEFDKKNWLGLIAGAVIIIGSMIFLGFNSLSYFIMAIGLIIGSIPFVISVMAQSGVQRDKEEKFLAFIRDLVENVKSGTPVSKSILNLQNRDYGALTNHVRKLGNQISLGIPLTQALFVFAQDTKSRVIKRSVSLISEAEKSGGSIDVILESVSQSVNQTEILRKEQKSSTYNLVVQGYIIFVVFIVIMLVLQFKILPLVSDLGSVKDLNAGAQILTPEEYSRPLFMLLLTQAFFAGLVIGKISEGTIKDGIKHSFILVIMALLINTGANAFLG